MVKFLRTFTEKHGRTFTEKQCLFQNNFKPSVFDNTGLCDRNLSTYAGGIFMFKKSYMQNTFVITRYHKVGEESLTAELVNWQQREPQNSYVGWF